MAALSPRKERSRTVPFDSTSFSPMRDVFVGEAR
jgi:hypothetical protein